MQVVFVLLGGGGVFSYHTEHFGLQNVKTVVSVAELNFLPASSEVLSTNLARIKDFTWFQ